MKPQTSKVKEIKRAKYAYKWYKLTIKLFRNSGMKDYKNDTTIGLSQL